MKYPVDRWRIRAKAAVPDAATQKQRRGEIAALLAALFPPAHE